MTKENTELRLSAESLLRINMTQGMGSKKCLEICGRR